MGKTDDDLVEMNETLEKGLGKSLANQLRNVIASLAVDPSADDQEEMREHHIPFIKESIIKVFNLPDSPYAILEHFSFLEKKLARLPQYGIMFHKLNDASYYHNHTRAVHSIDVALVGEKISRNNKLDKKFIDTMILLGLLHDIATPAWGDTTMKIFRDLSEELNFQKFLGYYPEVGEFISDVFHITIDELAPFVKNE